VVNIRFFLALEAAVHTPASADARAGSHRCTIGAILSRDTVEDFSLASCNVQPTVETPMEYLMGGGGRVAL